MTRPDLNRMFSAFCLDFSSIERFLAIIGGPYFYLLKYTNSMDRTPFPLDQSRRQRNEKKNADAVVYETQFPDIRLSQLDHHVCLFFPHTFNGSHPVFNPTQSITSDHPVAKKEIKKRRENCGRNRKRWAQLDAQISFRHFVRFEVKMATSLDLLYPQPTTAKDLAFDFFSVPLTNTLLFCSWFFFVFFTALTTFCFIKERRRLIYL